MPPQTCAWKAERESAALTMMHFAKPENALRRADELISVGRKDDALVALHDVLSSKRHRTWQPAIEAVILRFLTVCVEAKKGKAAKDGLIQYRIICQQINVASMETVLRHFMTLADTATTDALSQAESIGVSALANLLDMDDLEAEETPESLMLATIGGQGDSKKRTERQVDDSPTGAAASAASQTPHPALRRRRRPPPHAQRLHRRRRRRPLPPRTPSPHPSSQVVTPSLKFLWETFRTVLEILRNNSKLEELYKYTASRAFAFCIKYKRGVEFRRLCEILRNHIQSQTKYDPKWKDREPPTPESLQMHLETRFAQLSTAIEMELWQEAYRTVEDVHSLISQMKRPPRPATMAGYHAQLAQIFSVADNHLFHAYALARLYTISKGLKNPPGPEEMQSLASRAVLAALAIPPTNPVLDLNLLEYDLEHEKTKRMASMLSFPASASRVHLLAEVKAKGILAAARPDVVQLHAMLEAPHFPLDLAAQAGPVLAGITGVESLAQYDVAMRRLVGLRMLQQMERVYIVIRIEHVQQAISLLGWPEIESLMLWAVKRDLLTLRIDYKSGTINQRATKADATASAEVRDSLSRFATALEAVGGKLHAAEIERRKAEVRARLYGSIESGVQEEHQKILSRRLIIERRKEELERVTMETEKESARLRALTVAADDAEERARLTKEGIRREAERAELRKEEEQQAEMRKLAAAMAEQRLNMKITKMKVGEDGVKIETDIEKLATKSREELVREQRELMMDERTEFEKRLETMTRRHDYLERARREVEREVLKAKWETQQLEDRKTHAEQAEVHKVQMQASRVADVAEKGRFSRMSGNVAVFTERLMSKRREAHVEVVAAWHKDQAEHAEERRRLREEAEAEERAREEMIDRARREAEEEEARRIQEEAEKAAARKAAEEERERVNERMRARETELEEKKKSDIADRAAERLQARDAAGKSWAADDDDGELPQLARTGKPEGAPKGDEANDGWKPAGGARGGGGRGAEGAEWERRPLSGAAPPPARDGPQGRGGDRWGGGGGGDDRGPVRGGGFEPRGDRGGKGDGPPRGGGDDRGPPQRGGGFEPRGDRGPPRGGGDDRGPPQRGGGFEPRGDRGGKGDGPPRGGKGDGPPRDRPPPRSAAGGDAPARKW